MAEEGGRAQERSLGGQGGPQPIAARQWDLSSARNLVVPTAQGSLERVFPESGQELSPAS